MKNLLSFLLIALPIIGKSQIADPVCIESRWIALESTEANQNLFFKDLSENDSIDLVFTIKKLVEEEKISISNQNHRPYRKSSSCSRNQFEGRSETNSFQPNESTIGRLFCGVTADPVEAVKLSDKQVDKG